MVNYLSIYRSMLPLFTKSWKMQEATLHPMPKKKNYGELNASFW